MLLIFHISLSSSIFLPNISQILYSILKCIIGMECCFLYTSCYPNTNWPRTSIILYFYLRKTNIGSQIDLHSVRKSFPHRWAAKELKNYLFRFHSNTFFPFRIKVKRRSFRHNLVLYLLNLQDSKNMTRIMLWFSFRMQSVNE